MGFPHLTGKHQGLLDPVSQIQQWRVVEGTNG